MPKRRETTFTSSGWETKSAMRNWEIVQFGNLVIENQDPRPFCCKVFNFPITKLHNYSIVLTAFSLSYTHQESGPSSRWSGSHESRNSLALQEPSCTRQCTPLLPA